MCCLTPKQIASLPRLIGLGNAYAFIGISMVVLTKRGNSNTRMEVKQLFVNSETTFEDVIIGFKKLFADEIAIREAEFEAEWLIGEDEINEAIKEDRVKEAELLAEWEIEKSILDYVRRIPV